MQTARPQVDQVWSVSRKEDEWTASDRQCKSEIRVVDRHLSHPPLCSHTAAPQNRNDMQSPYFTPPRRASARSTPLSPPVTPTKAAETRSNRRKRVRGGSERAQQLDAGPRRSKRLSTGKVGRTETELPPTPKSTRRAAAASRTAPERNGGTRKRPTRAKRFDNLAPDAPPLDGLVLSDDLALGPIVPALAEDQAELSHLPKVILAQGESRR